MGKIEATAVSIVFVGRQEDERATQHLAPSRKPLNLRDTGFFPDENDASAFHGKRQVLNRRTAQTPQIPAFAGSFLDVLGSDLFRIGVIARRQVDYGVVNVVHQCGGHVLCPLKAGLKHCSRRDVCRSVAAEKRQRQLRSGRARKPFRRDIDHAGETIECIAFWGPVFPRATY